MPSKKSKRRNNNKQQNCEIPPNTTVSEPLTTEDSVNIPVNSLSNPANSDGNIPILVSTNSDGNTPILISTNSDGNTPILISTNSDGNIPILVSTNSDGNIPILVSTNSDGNTPILASANSDGNTGILPCPNSEVSSRVRNGLLQEESPNHSMPTSVKDIASSKPNIKLVSNNSITPTMQMKFLPKRPDNGGKIGSVIPLTINCLNIIINPMKVYKYDVELTKAEIQLTEGKRIITPKIKRKEIFKDVLAKYFAGREGHPLFDEGRILITNKLLPLDNQENQIEFVYLYENQPVTCYFTLKYITEVELSDINEFVRSREGRSNQMPQETIKVLDMIMKSMFLEKNFISIDWKIFDPSSAKPISCGPYEILDGYSMTVRPHMSQIRFNFDKTQIVCHQSLNLKNYIEKLPNIRDFNFSNKNINRALYQLKVRADYYKSPEGNNYSRSFVLKGMYNKSAEEEIIEEANQTVNEYFKTKHGVNLQFPKLSLVEATNTNKFPVEVLTVLKNQKMMGNDANITRDVIKHSAVPCSDRLKILQQLIKQFNNFRNNEYLKSYKVEIIPDLITLNGRILEEPVGSFEGKEEPISKGKWTLQNKRFKDPFNEPIMWGFLAFGTQKDYGDEAILYRFEEDLPKAALKVNVNIKRCFRFEYITLENIRKVINEIVQRLKNDKDNLDLLVCVIRNEEEYRIVKEIGDIELGIVTQCVNYLNLKRQNNLSQYLGNIMLKINAKLGGSNWEIKNIKFKPIPNLFMVFGIDVTHPSSKDKISESVASVVGSINKSATVYSACIEQQISQQDRKAVEIVIKLEDMVFELLQAFHDLNEGQYPKHLIFYRDGVSEGQFEKVFEHEIGAVRGACTRLNIIQPKITYIIVQKRHKIRFFPNDRQHEIGRSKNVPAGVVVDQDITHSREFDFYLCSHEGIQGTSRPVHYHVIFDENNWSSDDLQKFTYFLCYLCFRCTRSISYPAPTYYAHLAAFRGRVIKDEDSMSLHEEENLNETTRISINTFHQNKMFFI